MKRSSVRYNVTPSYSRNIESEKASANVRRNGVIVLTVGIILIALVFIFILKNANGALLLGALVPGNPFDEASQDEAKTNVVALVIAFVLIVVGIPLSFFLA
jgi:preprotein translocase subunit SecF